MKRVKLIVLGLIIAAAGALYLNRDTWSLYREQAALKRDNDRLMQEAERERAELLDRRADVESSIGQEKLARQQGYKKPGEEEIPPAGIED